MIAVIERSTNLSPPRGRRAGWISPTCGPRTTWPRWWRRGCSPAPGEEPALVRSPRVGDGLLRLGRAGKVTYASPNALSAYRRLGLTADLVGAELGPLTARLCARASPATTR